MSLREDGGKTLITPSGGSGGSVTIDAPLGSQPAANSISVAIASDQLPLPVTATLDTTLLAKEAKQDTEITRLTSILAQLDVALSTRASQVTLASILTQLDVALSTRASQATVASILGQLDVALSTRASEATLSTRGSEATLATLLTEAAFQARINTLGQKLMAASTPVVIASDQSAIPVTGPLTDTQLRATPVDVSGTVSVNEPVTVDAANLDIRDLAFATDKVDVSGSVLGSNSGVDIGDVTINNGAGASAVNIQDGGNSLTVDGTVTANQGTPAASTTGWPIANKQSTFASASWSSATPPSSTLDLDVTGFASVILGVAADVGSTTGAISFFISIDGGLTYVAYRLAAGRSSNAAISSDDPISSINFVNTGSISLVLSGNLAGATHFRVMLQGAALSAPLELLLVASASTNVEASLKYIRTTDIDAQASLGTTIQRLFVVGGYVDDTATVALAEGQKGMTRVTPQRAFHTNLRTNGGAELLGQQVSAASIPVVIASNQSAIPAGANVVSDSSDPYTIGQTGQNLTQTAGGRLRVEDNKLVQFNSTTMTEVLKEIRNEMRINNYLLRVGFEGKLNELRLFDDTASFDSIAGGQPNIVRIDDFTQN